MIVLLGQAKSTQTIYRSACNGKIPTRYMTKEGKAIKARYINEARLQWRNEPLEGDLRVDIVFFHGDKRQRDVDNFNKLVLDALSGIVWYDDKQIVRLAVEKRYDKENPRIEITINE